jgi:hypothetical protein
MNQTPSKNIVEKIVPIIKDLENLNYIVSGVCTSNFSNEVATFSLSSHSSGQAISGNLSDRVPCACHIFNLIIEDFLSSQKLGVIIRNV